MRIAASVSAIAIVCLTHLPPASQAAAARADKALFAIIVGVNQGIDRKLPRLRYADDDAARYFDLFRLLGARTYLLSHLDANTRRLHPQAAAEALAPRHAALSRVVRQARSDISLAKSRGLETILYFVYAGHGNVRNGEGYVGLADARLTGTYLAREVVDRVDASWTHLIVDACHSYYLAFGRGPGGSRRQLEGFSRLRQLTQRERVGLLLSTSSARESHEWEGFQAGVFSHEVRSGLYGAADADGDRQVSYREIAAFIQRANEAIPNDRYRPRVFARPPGKATMLVDLRQPLRRHISVPGSPGGRYLLESKTGVRLADFHNTTSLQLLRPAGSVLYLRRLTDQQEYVIPGGGEGSIALAALTPTKPRTTQRGAAHDAYSLVFSLAFDKQTVDRFRFPHPEVLLARAEPAAAARSSWRRAAIWSAAGVATASLAGAIALTTSAHVIRDDAGTDESQREVASINDQIRTRNTAAAILYGVAAAAALTSVVAWLWPDSSDRGGVSSAGASLHGSGGMLTYRRAF